MIQKSDNVYKHPRLKRIVEHNGKQINFLDQRFYKTEEGLYYPSVTSILNFYPKNAFFHNWLKDVGHSSDVIVKKASEEGTAVHTAIEAYLEGEEIKWMDSKGNAKYSLDAWRMILRFAEFWSTHKPELLASEIHLLNHEHKYAGTCDLVLKIKDKNYLLDIKTSNSLHTSYNLQLSAYAEAWNTAYPEEKIDEVGVLWLKSSKRKLDEEKFTGKGWEIKFPDKPTDEYFKMFLNIYEIYLLENPNQKPLFESYPTSVKLD